MAHIWLQANVTYKGKPFIHIRLRIVESFISKCSCLLNMIQPDRHWCQNFQPFYFLLLLGRWPINPLFHTLTQIPCDHNQIYFGQNKVGSITTSHFSTLQTQWMTALLWNPVWSTSCFKLSTKGWSGVLSWQLWFEPRRNMAAKKNQNQNKYTHVHTVWT